MEKFKILYEDNNFLAIDKPSGLLVYSLGNDKDKSETLTSLVSEKLSFKKPTERSGIVHRLDKETSGVILVAKNVETEEKLKDIFKNREIKKFYKALVWGDVKPGEGRIEIPLARSSKDRLRVVPRSTGKPSITNYKKINYYPKSNMSLLDIEIETGRMHQIRVHLASIGFPIVGDKKYSKRKANLNRQFLHAEKLIFKDPNTNKVLTIKSELAIDLAFFLKDLG